MSNTGERIETFELHPFLDGPSEALVRETVRELKRDVWPWTLVFGQAIDRYKRMDYSFRQLPAIRIYNDRYVKQYESWFEIGDLTMDIIFPASIRREETQDLQDMVGAAMIQQLRSQDFFQAVCAKVPGLNELGKVVDVDKTLGFEWKDDIVPMTELTVNFRIDLRQWDSYLESQDRTREQPFKKTLGDLKLIVGQINALREDGSTELSIQENITIP